MKWEVDFMSTEAIRKRAVSGLIFPSFLILICLLSTTLSDELSGYVKSGMELAALVIIPSVFPFMILSDLIACTVDFSAMGRFGCIFKRLFSVSSVALGATVIGMLAGFPIGARMVAELYRRGSISRRDAEVIAAVASTPSLAFTVSGVGAAMLGDVRLGVVLYLSVILSAVITGVFIRGDLSQCGALPLRPRRFDLFASIESATRSSLGIIGVVTAFSVVAGLVRDFLGSLPAAFILPFLELGGAASFIASASIDERLRVALIGFSLGFSGLSVHLQIRGALADTDIGYRRFLFMKLAEGALTAAIASVFHCFCQ